LPTPINTTIVPPVAASASQSTDRGAGDRGGDPRNDLERDPGVGEVLGLLAAAAEDERIAAFQPHDALFLARQLDEPPVRVLLWRPLAAGALADVLAFRLGDALEDRRPRQLVVEDDVGRLDQPRRLHGE
jgi:hypothetical protein